jgi:hypothetical protein
MERPSIAMRPRAYKEGKVYSVLPINGGADFTFARATTATNHNGGRINSGKDLEYVGNNVPKLHHLYGACPYLGLEPAATNLFPYSEDFSKWSGTGGALEDGYPSPDGGNNAYTLTNNGIDPSNQQIRAGRYKFIPYTSGIATFSVFVKDISEVVRDRSVLIQITNSVSLVFGFASNRFAQIYGDVLDYGYEKLDNGWYRLFISAQNITPFLGTSYLPAISLQGYYLQEDDFGDGIYIFGAQLEETPYLTSYIPTSGQSVSRTEETMYKDNLSNYINSSEGVLYFEAKSDFTETTRRITLSDGTFDNRIILQYQNDGVSLSVYVVLNGVNEVAETYIPINQTDYSKIAFKWRENDFSLWINGDKIPINTSGSTYSSGVLNKLSFHDGALSITNPFYGNIKDLRVYTTALTTDELTELTS